jgi:large conductance mechanosensitive channel
MIKGFKEFILRGNVVDLAVAVVIGAAFGTIVTAFTDKIVNPIIASLGGADAGGLGFSLRSSTAALKESTFLDFAVITAAINFLIIAGVIYLVLVVPMNKLAERRKRGEAPVEAVPTEDVVLLKEIRDLLARNSNAS